ncbi:MAG: DUF2142 domain-containing protein, partial [Micromonosporaceae bacterium]|nr:DUF2142 domain-containing protein [Micromonosporaceae bacterium]
MHDAMAGTDPSTLADSALMVEQPPGGPARPAPNPNRVRVAFLVAVLGFLGIAGGWAVAMPFNGTYDEASHIIRAYGVASGQIVARDGTQRVPRSLLPGQRNCQWHLRLAANCQTPPANDRHRVSVPTGAAGYSPLYYLPVGLPLLIAPDHGGIIAARLVSALLAALLLGAAFAIAVALRNRLLMAAIPVVATPMVANLAGAINPNGTEIAAGVLLWTCLLALLRTGRAGEADALSEPVRHRLVQLATIAGVLLLWLRHLGPVLVAISLLAAWAIARPGRVRELLRRRDVRIAGVVLAVALAIAAVWILVFGRQSIAANAATAHPDWGLTQILVLVLVSRLVFYAQQVVGQFSYGETTLPAWLYIGWYVLVAAMALPAVLLSGRRYRRGMAGLLVACVGFLVVLELAFVHSSGWFAHARYVMPAGVGLVLGAAFVRRWAGALGSDGVVRLARLAIVVTAAFQLYALAAVMTRFQAGPDAVINPWYTKSWSPPGGPTVSLIIEAAGL